MTLDDLATTYLLYHPSSTIHITDQLCQESHLPSQLPVQLFLLTGTSWHVSPIKNLFTLQSWVRCQPFCEAFCFVPAPTLHSQQNHPPAMLAYPLICTSATVGDPNVWLIISCKFVSPTGLWPPLGQEVCVPCVFLSPHASQGLEHKCLGLSQHTRRVMKCPGPP